MFNILIVYSTLDYPLRSTIRDHLYSFRETKGNRYFYLNTYYLSLNTYVFKLKFDLIIFHTNFLGLRWNKDTFWNQANQLDNFKTTSAIKAILPQDEFIHSDVLSEFIASFNIDHVFSVSPPSEWIKIYQGVDFQRVAFSQILTGYLSNKTLLKIQMLEQIQRKRTIDIGYRAWHSEAWLGRHGLLKVKVAEEFQRVAADFDLITDISTEAKDTIVGDKWFEFLLECKYTIGVEGGASLLDRDGSIRNKTHAFIAEAKSKGYEPTFEEIEAACFPGLDGTLKLFALSPRHLEACVTKTCQILIEGEYNGVLKPYEHYIPLKPDFSNLSDVLNSVQQDELRSAMIENAYQDIVVSNKYSYTHFVNFVVNQALVTKESAKDNLSIQILSIYNGMMDHFIWGLSIIRLQLLRHVNASGLNYLRKIKHWMFG